MKKIVIMMAMSILAINLTACAEQPVPKCGDQQQTAKCEEREAAPQSEKEVKDVRESDWQQLTVWTEIGKMQRWSKSP
ncbi:hypothetical protein [Pseudalkalibacillus sp. SCS-8]|uniref:hypothetical protein n=1 Tax=Pseudalkalibacillus nanhaiensis TaxID=3115291 RepID=UPI0032DA6484